MNINSTNPTNNTIPIASVTAPAVEERPAPASAPTERTVQEQPAQTQANKGHAAARRSENQLAAVVRKEKLAASTQRGISREIDALATSLNSGGEAAEGVREGLAAAYNENKPGQHQRIADCLRQLAASGSDEHSKAYQALKNDIRELTSFDPSGATQSKARDFYREVASLKGPGSARVKADMAIAIQENIELAKKEPAGGKGMRAYAGIYTEELGKMLNSDTPGIFNRMENNTEMRSQIPGMIDNLLNHKGGDQAIGQMVVGMTAATTKSLVQSPDHNRSAARRLGSFLGHVEAGIERNAKTREQMIEKGARLLEYGLKAAEKLSPGHAGEGFKKVYEGIDWLKNRDLKKVEDAQDKVRSTMYDLVDSTFNSIADPHGNLSAGYDDVNGLKVDHYNAVFQVYEDEFLKKRQDALTRESLR